MLLSLRGSCLPVTVLLDLKFLRHRATSTTTPQHSWGVRLCPTVAQSLCASVPSSAQGSEACRGEGTVQPQTSQGPHLARPVLREAERFVQLSKLETEDATETHPPSH